MSSWVRRGSGVVRAGWAGVLSDVLVLAVTFGLVWALDRSSSALHLIFAVIPRADVGLLLVSVAAACAAMAAILSGVIDRLSTDRRAVWISAAFTLYGVVGVPAAALTGSFGHSGVAIDVTRFAAHLGTAVLFGIAAWGPRRPAIRLILVAVSGLVWVGLAALCAWLAPDLAQAAVTDEAARAAVAAAVAAAGVALVVAGLRERSPQLARVGTAVAAMGAAHAYRLADQQPGVSLTFASVRLLALVMALWGLLQITRQTLGAVQDSESRRTEELSRARQGLARAEQRDRELRARLTRLAGVAELLGESPCEESAGLRSAVRAELIRLEAMIADGPAGAGHRRPLVAYEVAPMVQDLVRLRRASGMDIRCDIDGTPWADGSPTVLKQVLVNLLANCARHAPGSPVRVQLGRRGEQVRLRVSDFGPGVPGGLEQAVFERGQRSPAGGGQGLGLHICRELLEAEGGKIEIRPPSSTRAGCTVIVEVPKAKRSAGRSVSVAGPV